MRLYILAAILVAIVLAIAASPAVACDGYVGGGAFSVVQQPVYAQSFAAVQTYSMPQRVIFERQRFVRPQRVIVRPQRVYGRGLNISVGRFW